MKSHMPGQDGTRRNLLVLQRRGMFFVDDTNDTLRVVYEGGLTVAQLIIAENPSVSSPQVGYIYDLAGGEGTAGTPSNGTLGTNARLKAGAGLASPIRTNYGQDTEYFTIHAKRGYLG